MGDLSLLAAHLSMASLSYVYPSSAMQGSRMNSWVIGQTKMGGTLSFLPIRCERDPSPPPQSSTSVGAEGR
eukprot:CAMPEP_0197494604 /NCGR_PEP_ID=MMETSP1311-20131121/31101_1 /TAXON_ID=464262 /ORGANISM="Genus nov. species nov., Strain RCC856" /LENGTH=70 /DNA_ID=CAMNT_0043040017 /DNA_START=166 /DNA_END=375 /DNA_ORIENTATION=+